MINAIPVNPPEFSIIPGTSDYPHVHDDATMENAFSVREGP